MGYRSIWLETTTRCNLRCKTCGRSQGGEDMPLDLFTKIADECFPHIEEVNMTGLGEPTVTKHFVEMCSIVLNKYKKKISLISNGMLLNRNEDLFDILINDNVSLVLSIDGTEETYNSIRQGASWASMLELLEKIKVRRKKKISFSLGMNFVLSRENKSELLDIVKKAARAWDCDHFCLIMMQPWHGNDGYYKHSSPIHFKKEANDLIDEVGKTTDKFNMRVMLPSKFTETEPIRHRNRLKQAQTYISDAPARAFLKYPMFFYYRHYNLYRILYRIRRLPRLRCDIPFEMLYFKVNGDVTPCCGLQNHILGSVKNTSIFEVLKGEPYEALIRNMAYKYLPPECFRCNLPIGIYKGTPDR